MTDYRRSHGSQPWSPEDPLFGDRWGDPYQQQQEQQQQQQEQQQYQQVQQYQQTYGQGGWDPYAAGQQPPQHPYPDPRQDPQQYPQQYQQHVPPQPLYDAWGNPVAYGGHHGAATAGQPHDPYRQEQYRVEGGHGGPEPDTGGPVSGPGAGTPGYQEHLADPAGEPAEAVGWDADLEGPADDHPFFSGTSGDEDAGRAGRRRGGRAASGHGDRPAGGRKRRSGFACLVVTLILGGGLGGAGLFAYSFYQEHFGPPPDYSGPGAGEVQVEIPDGATLTAMGNILKKDGVVRSVDAFNEAAKENTRSLRIQGGVYVLRKQMAAASAITMMLDPAAQSVIIVTEGMRDAQVYQAVDRKLNLSPGTTRKVAAAQARHLGLPAWADDNPKIKDPLEGFLYPSRYSVGKSTKPADLLRQMVARAGATYARYDLPTRARTYGLTSPLELVTVASLVQAEGKTDDDFRKMARVVYNRLRAGNTETNGFLEFDSTYNYLKNQSKIDLSVSELRNYNDPYNTYYVKGLPPGPIGNPGQAALEAALNPATGNWYYFVSVDGQTTQFTDTLSEHDKLVRQFNENQQKNG